ncbi:Tat binding protein 1-interacting [Penicillium expansum]|nr:Tat binding protein 1-interacting [Penicillium expansum]
MAPRKPKSDAAAGDDDASMIREYLRQQNRPYSAIDVSANLHNKVTKTQAAKLLRDLHEKKQIEGRASGKQTVYHALQDPSDVTTPEVAAAVKLNIESLEREISTLKAKEKKARAELAALHAKPRISDLRQDISRLESELSMIQARLASRHKGDPVQISPEEREKLEKEWKYWQWHANVRRRICCDLWGQCSEVLPENMTAAELWVSSENDE